MLDLKLLRENTDDIKKALTKKKVDVSLIDLMLKIDSEKRELQTQMEGIQAEMNKLAKEIPTAEQTDRPALVEKSKALKEKFKYIEPTVQNLEKQLNY